MVVGISSSTPEGWHSVSDRKIPTYGWRVAMVDGPQLAEKTAQVIAVTAGRGVGNRCLKKVLFIDLFLFFEREKHRFVTPLTYGAH